MQSRGSEIGKCSVGHTEMAVRSSIGRLNNVTEYTFLFSRTTISAVHLIRWYSRCISKDDFPKGVSKHFQLRTYIVACIASGGHLSVDLSIERRMQYKVA